MESNRSNTKKNNSIEEAVINEIGKLPPQNLDAEKALLGGILLEPDSYYEISGLVKPESFYMPAHRHIFEAARRLDGKNSPIDVITVQEELREMGKLEEAGGVAYLSELSFYVTSAANIATYADIIRQKFLARELIKVSSNIQRMAFDEQVDINELVQSAEGQIFTLSQDNIKKDIVPIAEVLREAVERIQKAGNIEGGFTGVRSGFDELDKITNGWQPGTLNIIAARPAMGKTAFVLSMAKNMALQYDCSVAFFSLEMSTMELVNRLIINTSEIDGEKIKRGNLTGSEWEELLTKVHSLNNAHIYLDETPGLSVFELCSKARKLKREHNVDCIIIDYLQLMNASGMNFGSREQEVSMISRSLKALAKELNVPVIALSQLNRGVETRTGSDKRPQLSDLRESGAIEQDADIVILLHRPEYYGQKDDGEGHSLVGVAEVIIAKHRSGSVGNVNLSFKHRFVKFDNLNQAEMFESESENFKEMNSKINSGSYGNAPFATPQPDNKDPF